ncbi:MATE family efflux transporter [Desulfovibrio piger]
MTKNRFFSLNEARRFLALGLPVLVTQIAQMGMNFVDTAMTGQASTADMAAVAVSGSIWVPVSLLGMGCLLSLPAMMAHLVGGGEQQRTPHLLRQGLWLSTLLSLVLMGVFAFLSLHLELFGLDAELAPLAAGYLRAMLFGLPGMMLFVNVRGFLEGYARTRPAMLVGLLGLALNVPCNYVLIYGKLGLPQLGAVGCGVATALCYWFMGLTLALYARREARCRKLGPLFLPLLLPRTAGEGGEARRVDWPLVWRIFRIGLPGALAACFEASLFAVTALLLAPLGKVVVAGHQIAMNFSSIVYMLPLSLNITVAIRVGQNLGAGRLERARLSARTALCLGLAVGLLVFAAVNQIPESLQTVSIGVLRAYNDTRYILGVCLFSYWIVGLGTGWTLARTDWLVPAMGATGFWIGYGLALWVSFSLYRLRMGRLHRLDAEAVRQRIRR